MILLVDSNLLIDALRGRQDRQSYLADMNAKHDLAVTAINVAELYAGVRPNEMPSLEAILQPMDVFALTESLARQAGLLKNAWARRGRMLTLDDAIIAAVAISHNIPLLTDNVRDFPMPELKLWPLPRIQ